MSTTHLSAPATLLSRATALGAVTACALGIAPVVLAPQAAAAPVQAQQTYACSMVEDAFPDEPGQNDLTANITLNLPEQVVPGDSFSVGGTFSIPLPTEIAAMFASYVPHAQFITDTVTLPVTIAGQDQLVSVSRIDSGQVSTRNLPVVFSGEFVTDAIAVPADAQGDVSFSMPRNDSVPAINTDGMAAFTALLIAAGGLIPGYEGGTSRADCTSATGESKLIGSVPIGAGAATGGQTVTPGTGVAAGGVGAPAASTAGTTNRVQAAQGAASTASSTAAKATTAADKDKASTGQGSTDQALADQLRLMSMNQAAAGNGDGAYLSKSALGWGTLGIVAASVLFTVLTNSRTRRMERSDGEY